MKHLYLIVLSLILIFSLAGCASTEPAADTVEEVASAQSEVISTPETDSTPVVIEEAPVTEEPVVMEEAPEVTASEPSLDEQFSFIYGYLLVDGLKEQALPIDPVPFVQGSDDFFNGVDAAYSDTEINDAFTEYQKFVSSEITEEEFSAATDLGVSAKEIFSYGYGHVVQFNLQSQGVIVDIESFNDGMSSSYGELPLQYSDQEIDQIFEAYIEKLNAQYAQAVEGMASENLEAAEAFLAENGTKEGVITTESGLQYTVVREGDGAQPTAEDTVLVDYQITFLDGSIGDNSYARGEPTEFPIAQLIPGFIEGLPLMKEGAQYRFFLHPSLAYGEAGNQNIAPNTLLIFDVELHEVL